MVHQPVSKNPNTMWASKAPLKFYAFLPRKSYEERGTKLTTNTMTLLWRDQSYFARDKANRLTTVLSQPLQGSKALMQSVFELPVIGISQAIAGATADTCDATASNIDKFSALTSFYRGFYCAPHSPWRRSSLSGSPGSHKSFPACCNPLSE
jgi:hypothetical protein